MGEEGGNQMEDNENEDGGAEGAEQPGNQKSKKPSRRNHK